jgi:hypothetical protein
VLELLVLVQWAGLPRCLEVPGDQLRFSGSLLQVMPHGAGLPSRVLPTDLVKYNLAIPPD